MEGKSGSGVTKSSTRPAARASDVIKKWTFAANLSWLFQEWPFLDRFAAAADAGLTAVEYLFPYDHAPGDIAQRLARHGLKQVLFNLPPGDFAAGERGIAALAGREADFRASVETALNYARATGTPRLHLMAGIAAGEGAMALYRDALKFACEAAARDGIEIVIEPINGRDIPGYLMNDFTLAQRLIEGLQLPNLGLQFDIYHRQILHGDVTRGLQALLPITRHIQVASVPLRQEPTTGELDDARVFDTLTKLGYDGFVGCEYRPANGTLAGLGWMRSLI
jgi:2-dehydrotetronate isomerase